MATWWEGSGWDGGHDHTSGGPWDVGERLLGLPLHAPGTGVTGEHFEGGGRGRGVGRGQRLDPRHPDTRQDVSGRGVSHLSLGGSCGGPCTAYRG